MRYAEPIDRLIRAFSMLPGIGEKTATRLALYILNSSREYVDELAKGLLDAKEKVTLCSGCMAPTDADPCRICRDSGRDAQTVCVVSDYKDMMAIEDAGGYTGRYHILHGSLAPLKGVGPEELRIKELIGRVTGDDVKEVVLATGFDAEGEATSTYLAKLLKPCGVKLTRIASGVPVGGHVEYMDGATLERALEGRREVS
ncbi:MAG TPA: recombination mediator RecR [Thermodesulfobacteriota bacterium]|nr:recombination mediator RecR [Thermodesulfobacteriota bacterium]